MSSQTPPTPPPLPPPPPPIPLPTSTPPLLAITRGSSPRKHPLLASARTHSSSSFEPQHKRGSSDGDQTPVAGPVPTHSDDLPKRFFFCVCVCVCCVFDKNFFSYLDFHRTNQTV